MVESRAPKPTVLTTSSDHSMARSPDSGGCFGDGNFCGDLVQVDGTDSRSLIGKALRNQQLREVPGAMDVLMAKIEHNLTTVAHAGLDAVCSRRIACVVGNRGESAGIKLSRHKNFAAAQTEKLAGDASGLRRLERHRPASHLTLPSSSARIRALCSRESVARRLLLPNQKICVLVHSWAGQRQPRIAARAGESRLSHEQLEILTYRAIRWARLQNGCPELRPNVWPLRTYNMRVRDGCLIHHADFLF